MNESQTAKVAASEAARPVPEDAHGLPRTNADKRRAVTMLLEDEEWSRWPQTKIADACGVSQQFVSKVAASMPGASYNSSKTREVERNGTVYTQNTANIGRGLPDAQVRP